MVVKSKSPKRAAAPARGAGASKKAVEAAGAKAKVNAKTPGEQRAALAGNLPAKGAAASSLASKVPPPAPVRKPQTEGDIIIEMGNLEMRLTKSYAAIGEAEEAIKQAKKKRDGVVSDKETLVRELMDCARDLRTGQGRFSLRSEPVANSGAAPYAAKVTMSGAAQPQAQAQAQADKPADTTKAAEPKVETSKDEKSKVA